MSMSSLLCAEKDPWKEKYENLKRKCEEYEQMNDILFTRAKRMHQMIGESEVEKRFLMKRLEQYGVVAFTEMQKEPSSLSVRKLLQRSTAQRELSTQSLEQRSTSNGCAIPSCVTPQPCNNNSSNSAAPSPTPLGSAVNCHEEKSPNKNGTELLAPEDHQPVAPPPNSGSDAFSIAPWEEAAVSVVSQPPTTGRSASEHRNKARGSKVNSTTAAGNGKPKKEPKKKKRKGDFDPNAPKKPSNSYFWFCQEQRGMLQRQFKGDGVSGQHDLTKVLAKLWNETAPEDKKKYFQLYCKDKKRYDKEMQDYVATRQAEPPAHTQQEDQVHLTTTGSQ